MAVKFSPLMTLMVRAVEKAARSLTRDFGEVEQLQVSVKGPADFVSAADRRSEKILFDELSKIRPDIAFLMEESGVHGPKDAESRWIIDPLDGTTNFLHGLPHWSISLALETKGEIVAAIVYDPIKNEMFQAEKGTGAFLQNRRLRVSGRRTLDQAVIAGGSPNPSRMPKGYKHFLPQVNQMLVQTAGFRRWGAATLDLAYVAAGRFDGYWEYGIKPWDCAAGSLLIREAGGYCTTISGRDSPVHDGDTLATNGHLHDILRNLLLGSETGSAPGTGANAR